MKKAKMLYVLKVLWEETDEEHMLSASQIAQKVSAYGISCERKSIYTDLDQLEDFGFDLVRTRTGVYLGSRLFQLPELKLLADAVQSSRFITEKKSQELIGKLSGLAGRYQGEQLKGQVYIRNRVKNMDESIYYTVDAIWEGMRENRQILFQYYNWNERKELVPRHGGRIYQVSPWQLQWEDEKYYLIGYDNQERMLKHYRVDKMRDLEVIPSKRAGREVFQTIDPAAYGKEMFGMFQGERATVSLLVEKELAGAVIDRFGTEVWLHPVNDTHFQAVVDVVVSNQFFGWVAGLGGKVRIVEPVWVLERYKELLQELLQ